MEQGKDAPRKKEYTEKPIDYGRVSNEELARRLGIDKNSAPGKRSIDELRRKIGVPAPFGTGYSSDVKPGISSHSQHSQSIPPNSIRSELTREERRITREAEIKRLYRGLHQGREGTPEQLKEFERSAIAPERVPEPPLPQDDSRESTAARLFSKMMHRRGTPEEIKHFAETAMKSEERLKADDEAIKKHREHEEIRQREVEEDRNSDFYKAYHGDYAAHKRLVEQGRRQEEKGDKTPLDPKSRRIYNEDKANAARAAELSRNRTKKSYL